MITPAWCRVMAAYNAEMNRRLYAGAEGVHDAERKAARGAFFGSLHATLNHLLWADRMWMSRFDGWPRPESGIAGSTSLYDDFDALHTARVDVDAKLESWAAALTPEALSGPLTWFSGASARELTRPRWVAITHLFNHQTHHRGQAHCLLTQAGVALPATDLPFIVELDALALG